MLQISGTRKEMFGQIDANSHELSARILAKPSKAVFLHLLQKTKVEKIYMTPGIFATVPKKVLDALDGAGVSVEIVQKRAGRPAKFEEGKKIEALRMLKEGKTAAKISNKLGVPATSIYAWKRRAARKEAVVPDST
ncbi:MAG: transposase [Candidatus Micrarchaeota archaeon]